MAGQPGAGKTSLGKYIQKQYEDRGECVIEVGSDKIATYHRDYNELLKLLPDQCYILSRQFVRPAEPTILRKIRDNRLNIIQENCFNKGEKDYKSMQEFKKDGYEIQINIIAVDKYESFLSCIERDVKLLELGYDPRPIARINHDRMYNPILQELTEISARNLCDKINVFIRGKVLNQPELVYSTGDDKYSSAQEAVICERKKSRDAIMREPQKYLERIAETRQKIEAMIQDETMKRNYLEQIKQLEIEFLNELTFERSN